MDLSGRFFLSPLAPFLKDDILSQSINNGYGVTHCIAAGGPLKQVLLENGCINHRRKLVSIIPNFHVDLIRIHRVTQTKG